MGTFEPEKIFEALAREAVDYLVVGGVGATLHGSPLRTADTDVCPRRDPANLERLARALQSIHARIRVVDPPDGLPFACDARFFATVAMSNLMTDHGDLDLCFEPAGTAGYDDLVSRVVHFDLGGLRVPVADLADIVRSKEAANRPKDRATLPTLRALLARTRGT